MANPDGTLRYTTTSQNINRLFMRVSHPTHSFVTKGSCEAVEYAGVSLMNPRLDPIREAFHKVHHFRTGSINCTTLTAAENNQTRQLFDELEAADTSFLWKRSQSCVPFHPKSETCAGVTLARLGALLPGEAGPEISNTRIPAHLWEYADHLIQRRLTVMTARAATEERRAAIGEWQAVFEQRCSKTYR